MLSRRHLAKVSFASVIACAAFGRSNPAAAKKDAFAPLAGTFAGIERESGGRLGVFVLDTRSGASVGHRAGERFPMCSTFKLLAVAAILAKVDGGEEQLARRLEIKPSDILAYAPVSKQHVGDGLSIGELC
jgi:beta-lactamase class A